MEGLVLAVLSFVGIFAFASATVCHNNTECGNGECCYIKPKFQIVSKRDVDPGAVHLPNVLLGGSKAGVCETYKSLQTPCWPLETANGHCGCAPGTHCGFVPLPTDLAVSRRSIFMPGPGSYQCITNTP